MKPDELLEYAAKDPATWSKDDVRRLLREAATAITKQQQDAERYRWLRKNHADALLPLAWSHGPAACAIGGDADAAIDAAMAGANVRHKARRHEGQAQG